MYLSHFSHLQHVCRGASLGHQPPHTIHSSIAADVGDVIATAVIHAHMLSAQTHAGVEQIQVWAG